jgi:hypothetical protein
MLTAEACHQHVKAYFPGYPHRRWVECQPLLALICHRWLDCSAEPQMRVTRLNNHFWPLHQYPLYSTPSILTTEDSSRTLDRTQVCARILLATYRHCHHEEMWYDVSTITPIRVIAVLRYYTDITLSSRPECFPIRLHVDNRWANPTCTTIQTSTQEMGPLSHALALSQPSPWCDSV